MFHEVECWIVKKLIYKIGLNSWDENVEILEGMCEVNRKARGMFFSVNN